MNNAAVVGTVVGAVVGTVVGAVVGIVADEGATKALQQSDKETCQVEGDDRKYKHAWVWIWRGSEWTNKVRCSICNKEKINGV